MGASFERIIKTRINRKEGGFPPPIIKEGVPRPHNLMIKTIKKIAAAVMSAALILGTSVSLVPVSAVSTNNIDTTRTGSITIHKYEAADISAFTDTDTGEVIAASDLPQGITPLPGVTFQIKKVGEISTYFSGNNIQLPTPAVASSMPAIGEPQTATTGASGVASFNNLPLGVYFVTETNAPAQVNTRTADFVVCIPQSKVSDNTQWLYDINVYPKNETKYANFNIQKNSSAFYQNVAIEGAKFIVHNDTINQDYPEVTTGANGLANLQNLPANSTYTVRETFVPAPYLTNTVDTWTFKIDSTGQAYTEAVDNSTNPATVTRTNLTSNTMVLTNDKPEIHKSVVKNHVSPAMLENLIKNNGLGGENTSYSVSELLSLTEYIQAPEDNLSGWVADNKYNGGAYSLWKIKVRVPEHVESLKTFNVSDTIPNGFNYIGSISSMNGVIVSSDVPMYPAEIKENCTPEDDAITNYDLTWDFDTSELSAIAASTDPISYWGDSSAIAYLGGNEQGTALEASWDSITGATYGNELDIWVLTECNSDMPLATPVGSSALLSYSDTARSSWTGATDTLRTLSSETPTIYTGGFNLTKLGENNASLQGVQFAIYETQSDALNDTNRVAFGETDTNGNIVFNGLSYGSPSTTQQEITASGVTGGSTTYYIAELKAATGYNLLAAPKAITVNSTSHLPANTTTFWDTIMSLLPHTGGAGFYLYAIPAAALIGFGVFMIVRNKKRKRKDS